MAPADTPAAGSGTTPKTGLDPRTEHIFPILYIEAIRNRDALDTYDSKYRSLERKSMEVQRAIWGGVCALESEALKHLRNALRDGKLLMCWEGSRVVDLVKGGAS